MRKIVITGGPYSGKTSLINTLGREGYTTVPEAAISAIHILGSIMGLEEQKKWRRMYPSAFQHLLAAKQLRDERLVTAGETDLVFFDRSVIDNLGYCRLDNAEVPEIMQGLQPDYELAVICDTLENFDQRAGTGRLSDKTRSLAIRDAIKWAYQSHDIPIMELPEMSIEDRILAVKVELGVL